MIELVHYQNKTFLYNVDSWLELRKTYRIVGELIGNSSFIPALPVQFSPEEVLLLLEKELVTIVEKDVLTSNITQNQIANYKQFEEDLLNQQKLEYRRIRKIQLENMIDTIVGNRRKINDDRPPEEILKDELEKSCQVTNTTMIWPIFLEQQNKNVGQNEIDAKHIMQQTTSLKARVFKDLWEKGFYLTGGAKFGGDFLVYAGDPVVYHALFIVRCVDNKKCITPSEVVAFGRLGSSVKKSAVFASYDENQEISYITINWDS